MSGALFADARVWKFVIPMPTMAGRSFVDMPAVARPLSVAIQNDVLVVWALVDSEAAPEEHEQASGPRRFIVANTGAVIPDFPEGARFLGTVASHGIVWHVWDGDAETTA